jgi:GT2 family glycosyltransferase
MSLECGTTVGVLVASCGRPDELGQLLDALDRQTLAPSHVVLSVVDPSDLPPGADSRATVLIGGKGSCAQRNRGLDALVSRCDVLFICDDDYLPSVRALEGASALFEAYPDVVGANGRLIADGINSPGIGFEEATRLVRDADNVPATPPRVLRDLDGLYGCNMAFRCSAIGDARFDEALPLYGWQEDIDFSAQLTPKGRIVASDAFHGVHRGVKAGRTSGVRFGYSQVANPVYLMRKGTMTARKAFGILINNVAANLVKVWRPEPWVDRRGRVKGNWMAFGDLARGRVRPGRILDFS